MNKVNILPISIILILALISPNTSFAGLFGPSNYSECIEDLVSGAETEKGAKFLRYACKWKFDGGSKEKKKHADCLFDYLPEITSEVAAVIIYRACNNLDSPEKRKCLLKKIPPVKTDSAAKAIYYDCK